MHVKFENSIPLARPVCFSNANAVKSVGSPCAAITFPVPTEGKEIMEISIHLPGGILNNSFCRWHLTHIDLDL